MLLRQELNQMQNFNKILKQFFCNVKFNRQAFGSRVENFKNENLRGPWIWFKLQPGALRGVDHQNK